MDAPLGQRLEVHDRATALARREFMSTLATAAGALVALPGCRRPSEPAVSLTSAELAVTEAACARLVPTDDLPGAREAGVARFIDRELARPEFAVFRRELRTGVQALELLAAASFAGRFVDLTGEQQDEVLRALQDGHASAPGFSPQHFFEVLFVLTIEGLFSDPRHGGNRGGAGWQLLGFVP